MSGDSLSLVERLRAQRAARTAPKRFVLGVPGWGGPFLYVRYRPIAWTALTALLTDDASSAEATLRNNAGALSEAIDALLVSEHDCGPNPSPEDPRLTSLADELRAAGETIVGELRFDEDAVDALALDTQAVEDRLRSEGIEVSAESALATILATFDGAVSPELAVASHAALLSAWMHNLERGADGDDLGE